MLHPQTKRITWTLTLTVFVLLTTVRALAAPSTEHSAVLSAYQSAFKEHRFAAAVEQAQKLVALESSAAGSRSLALATALQQLGAAQYAAEDFKGAEASYAQALQLIEPQVGNTDRRLIEPLRGLGTAIAHQQRHKDAVPVLERAVLIGHRSDGLFNTSQQDLLLQLAASYTELGNFIDAQQKLIYLAQVCEHAYGAQSPEMARAIDPLADFYARAGDFERAQLLYLRGIALIERKLGPGDPAVLPMLRGYARVFVRQLFVLPIEKKKDSDFIYSNPTSDFPQMNEVRQLANRKDLPKTGLQTLQTALTIIDANPALVKSDDQLDTLLELGDWLWIKGDTTAALPYYLRAAQMKFTHAAGENADPLSFPVPVYYLPPPSARRHLDRPESQIDRHSVLIDFTVTSDGSVRDQTVVEGDATPRQANATMEALRNARYRPRIVDGAAVDTPGVRYREIFREPHKDKDDNNDSKPVSPPDSKAPK